MCNLYSSKDLLSSENNSTFSTVARIIQRFSKTSFTRNRPRKGRSKKLSPCAVHQVQKLASQYRRMSAAKVQGFFICHMINYTGYNQKWNVVKCSNASIALEVAEAEGQLVSAQTIHQTLQQVCLHGRHPRRKPLLKLAHRKACKQFAEDNLARAWITGTMSCGLISLRLTCLTKMVSRMCGDALVRSTKTIVPCLQSSMVVVASWSGAEWLLLVLGSCGSLRETWIPTCTVTFWSRGWCPPFRNCFPS